MSREAMQQALEALEQLDGIDTETECVTIDVDDVITALRQALETEQEPVAWMGIDIEGNPNKFRLNFFGGAIPLFVRNEDRTTIADNEKDGSPCPEFWDWLPRAYNFDGDGVFTKYNMEVAFLAGKQFADADDTSQKRVDEKAKREQEPVAWRSTSPDGKLSNKFACKPTESNWVEPLYAAPSKREWVGLTDEEQTQVAKSHRCGLHWREFAQAIEAKLKEKNHG